ncbi:MAG: caspase family protein [Mucilaginibacter sp.]
MVLLSKTGYSQKPHLILPFGHTDDIYSVDLSPDGKYVLTAGDNTAKIWQTADHKLLIDLQAHSAAVKSAKYSNDGKFIVTCSWDCSAIIWNAMTGDMMHKLIGHKGPVYSANFSNNGMYVITGSTDKTAILWNALSGKPLHKFTDFDEELENTSFAKDGNEIITVTYHQVTIWDSHNYKKIKSYSFKGYHLTVNANNELYVLREKYLVRVEDYAVKIYNILSGKLITTINDSSDPVLNPVDCVDISPDEKEIITYQGLAFNRYDLKSGRKIFSKSKIELLSRKYVKFGTDGKTFFYSSDNKLYEYLTSDASLIDSIVGQSIRIGKVKFSPDRKTFFAMGWDNVPRFIEANTGKILYSFAPFQRTQNRSLFDVKNYPYVCSVNDVRYTKDGKYLYIVSDHGIDIFNCVNQTLFKHLTQSGASVYFNPGQNKIMVSSHAGINIIDISKSENGKFIKLQGKDFFESPTLDPTGKYAILRSQFSDNGIYLYDVTDGKLLKTFFIKNAFNKTIRAGELGFSQDGTKIISDIMFGSDIWIFDINSGISSIVNLPSEHYISSFFMSPDNKYLVVKYSNGGCVRVNIENSKIEQSYDLSEVASYVDVSDDGTGIVASMHNFTCTWWKSENQAPVYTDVLLGNNDYLVTDSSGRYDGTPEARKLLYYVCGNEIITLDQMRELTWEPGLGAKLSGADLHPIVAQKLSDMDICGITPLVERMASDDNDYHYRITPRAGGLGQVLLWVNEQNIKTYQAEDLVPHTDYYELIITHESIKNRLYSDRDNTINVRAYAKTVKLISKGEPTAIKNNSDDSLATAHHLYCIAVGITKYKGEKLNTLHFAGEDAADMNQTITLAARRLLDTGQSRNHVTSYLLNTLTSGTSSDLQLLPYRDNIKRVFSEVANKANADDIVVVFLSGHGVLHSNQFYYLTAEASAFELDGVEDKVAISSDTLKSWLLGIRANKKILILDACNSGQTVESLLVRKDIPSDQKRALDNLNERTGTYILAASAAGHSAFEMSEYGQGILAYNLLFGIKSGGGLRDNQFLDIGTWFKFASDHVNLMAKDNSERQTPEIWGTGSAAEIDIGLADDQIKNKIVLSNKKPIVGRSSVFNVATTADDLQVESMIENELTELSYQGKSSKLVYISNAQGADTYKVNCQYEKNGNNVKGKVVLLKNITPVTSLALNSTNGDLQTIVKQLVDKITDFLDN